MNQSDNIYYEYLSLIKKYLYHRIQYILFQKFPFLFENNCIINQDDHLNAELKYKNFETENKIILDRYYLLKLKKRLSYFEFELLLILFFNIEDLKFNALIKKIKDPDKIPLSDEDYYELNLNEVLELVILDEKDKFITRKDFILHSYLAAHKLISFIFSDNISDNPLIFNENIRLSVNVINKVMNMDSQRKEMKQSLPYYNRLRIGEEGF